MKHLSPTDPVPSLRGDVVFSSRPQGSGAEVIHIRPIGFGEGTRLHGFELSLARMLDGQRSAEDVVQRATHLGLPLSVPALEGFIAHLEAHGLLARNAAEAKRASPWMERFEWDPQVREQYQSALRTLRDGQPLKARQKLERLLATAPLLEEARTLHSWILQHPTGVSSGETFHDTFHKAENQWLRGSATAPAADAYDDTAELRAVRRSYTPYGVLFGVLVVLVAGLLIPFPTRVSVPAALTPVTVTGAIAPVDGMIGEVSVQEGQWVTTGDPLLRYSEPEGAVLTAEAEGVVRGLSAVAARPVVEGQKLLELQDTRQLRLFAHLTSSQVEDVRVGQRATIALGARRAATTVNALSGNELVTTIENADGRMEPGNAVVDIDIGSRSLLQRMMK